MVLIKDIERYREAVRQVRVWMPEEALAMLREVRLLAWRTCVVNRKIQEELEAKGLHEHAKGCKVLADANLKAVTILNDYFPAGDYAQYDMESEDGYKTDAG